MEDPQSSPWASIQKWSFMTCMIWGPWLRKPPFDYRSTTAAASKATNYNSCGRIWPEIGGRRSAAGDRRPEIGGRWESISLNQVTSILQLIFFTQLRTGTESFIGNCSGHLYFEMQLQPKGRRCDTDKLIWYAGLCVFHHFESYSCKSRREKMPVLHWFKVQAMVQTMVDRSATICVFQ